MRLQSLLVSLAAIGFAGCAANTTNRTHINDHWSMRSVGPRMGHAFLGYDREKHGYYDDFQWSQKQDINLTVRRHFFNQNPENPFQPSADDYYTRARKPKNTLTRPVSYIHLEGIAIGAVIYAAGGPFLAIPIGSVLGSFETFDNGSRVATTSSMYEDLPQE